MGPPVRPSVGLKVREVLGKEAGSSVCTFVGLSVGSSVVALLGL